MSRDPRTHVAEKSVPLCVDLNGTLIRSDVLVESCLASIKANGLNILRAIGWLLRGKACLRDRIIRTGPIDVRLLPVNEDFLEWLRLEHRDGRRLVLCTAAHRELAEQVAARFELFETTIAGDASHSLSGSAKSAALEQIYGKGGFDYAGNAAKDLPVWRNARRAIVVAPTLILRLRLKAVPRLERIFSNDAPGRLSTWLRAMRIHQWAKNLLIFLPAVAAHLIAQPAVLMKTIVAFVWFGLCASATYLINDLTDLDNDRAHPRKRRRPFASGELTLTSGLLVAACLLLLSLVGSFLSLGWLFCAVLGSYTFVTLWYSFELKRVAMVDILTLAGLYTVRVLAGGAAINVVPSFWLLAFSMFLFLSLAAVKRYTELFALRMAGNSYAAGRGYTTEDLPLLLSCGISAGFVAVLVLALYINLGAGQLYRYPQVLWLLCPVVLYWVCRVWRKTHRGELHDDPVVFAIKDRPSLLVGALCLALAWLAT